MVVLASSNLVEGWIAGRLGPDAQAAAGIGTQIWFFLMLFTLALCAGTTAVVSRYVGAQQAKATAQAVQQALVLSLVFGFLSAAIGLASCRAVLHLLGASEAVTDLGFEYLKFSIVSVIPGTVLWISNSIFRACGNSYTPMLTMAIVTALVIVLDVVLCLDIGRLGLSGIGISWMIANSIGVAINFHFLRRTDLGPYVRPLLILRQPVSAEWMGRFSKIGLPAGLQAPA